MEVPAEMQYDIDGVFGVEAADIVIKQEPHDDLVTEDEVMESSFIAEDHCIDEHQVYPHPEEIDDVILQRAVSPPTYTDHCDPEELMLFYKEKFQLKDVTVQLENCDKIWQTLQLIKNIQGDSNEDDSSYQVDSPKNSFSTPSESPIPTIPTIPYQPTIGNSNKALPDFRFSVKAKKKLFHCVSCGKEFGDSQQLKQHALEDHGVYVNPKRIYKPRVDQLPKSIRLSANASNEGFASELQNPDSMVKIPLSQAAMQSVAEPMEFSQAVRSTDILNTENTENSAIGINAIVQEPPVKTQCINATVHEPPVKHISIVQERPVIKPPNKLEVKQKVKCILCKRITADIVSHMKGYHKVGCLSSIIAQCETVTDDIPVSDRVVPVAPDAVSQPVSEPMELDVPLPVTTRKRKRNQTRWTVPKKKFKSSATRLARLPIETVKVGFKKYKCDICFGIYKTSKSFSYHRKLHRLRGENPDNFDPSKCRFLNSPLRPTKNSIVDNQVEMQREFPKVQPSITNYIKPPNEHIKPSLQPQEQASVQNIVEPAVSVCECGRSFRNYHTLFLHKVKCRETDGKGSHANDSDSGIGISIKLKKNKNDSYEVVSRTTPTDESFKESRSCKDSDASSNDSGVVSVSSTSQKTDSSDLDKYKTVSVMRIQVEDNDEEVDIEDENSNQSNFNGNCYAPFNGHPEDSADTASSISTENDSLQNGIGPAKNSSRRNSRIPSLRNLCEKVLTKSKEINKLHRCLTCLAYFRNMTDLMEHVANMKHDVKSLCSCGKEFKSLKYYNIHVRRFHPDILNCNYCKTNFDRIEKYLGHKCNVMEGKLFIEPIIQTACMKCEALVDLGEPFDKHMKTHSTGSSNFYQCYKCDLTYDNPYQRRSHFSKEHGFSPCRVCGKVLHIDYLSKHEAYHDGLGHPCHLCKKTFSQKTLLKKHIQGTHDPLVNEVVKCIVCLKTVKLRSLKKHTSFHLHTEICKKCNKCYRSDDPNSFQEHMATDHLNDLPTLKCDTCQTTFVLNKDYEEHCQQGFCKNSANDAETTVQNATI